MNYIDPEGTMMALQQQNGLIPDKDPITAIWIKRPFEQPKVFVFKDREQIENLITDLIKLAKEMHVNGERNHS